MYQNISFQEYLPAIISSLRRGDLRALCDGYFDYGYGTAAVCLDGNGYRIRGVNIVPIDSDTLDLTQRELGEIYTIKRIAEYMVVYYQLENAAIEIGCNYERGLKRTLIRKTI